MNKNRKIISCFLVATLMISTSIIVSAYWENKGDFRDYGDAPEGINAIAYPSLTVTGSFPTCQSCGPGGWIQHDNYGAYFGLGVDFEYDGNGGTCPGGFPPYDQDEGFQDGDAGLIIPEPFTIDSSWNVIPFTGYTGTALGYVGNTAVWGSNIDIFVDNHMPGHEPYLDAFVNVLIDWNQDGDWMDAGEHVLVDFVVPKLYLGPLSGLAPPSFIIAGPSPAPGYVWTRFTITESAVGTSWYGEGDFEDGESEDYLLYVDEEPDLPFEVQKQVWNETLGDWDEYVNVEICTNVTFRLSITNFGPDPCTIIKIWDYLPPCVEYNNNATMNGIPMEPDVISIPIIEWNAPIPPDYWYPGSNPNELPSGYTLIIEFDVHVIGPACTDNVNWGYWDIEFGETYYLEDNATIHPIETEEPWSNHKMHFPQLPDPNGWDVFANFEVPFLPLADDWMCSQSGPVTDIHFWGSWFYNIEGIIDGFDISIWGDIPADESPTGYSMPDVILWNQYFLLSDIDVTMMEPSPQGWYDPYSGYFEPIGNHEMYFQYDIENITDPFIQENGTIYWLCIRPNVIDVVYPDPPLWGWKTSLDYWNDDAVYWVEPVGWMELYDPIEGYSLDLAFVITGEEEPCEPSIDIEKFVWDTYSGEWVDADTPGDAIDFDIGTTAQFLITIHNNGTCCNLTDIWVDDVAEEMEITSYSIFPDYYTYIPGTGTNLGWWSFTDYEPLPPCNWINITIEAEIEGSHCNIYNNSVFVEAYCEDQDIYVTDEDDCYIHAVNPPEYEFGDAPEGAIAYPSTMTMGAFPTCVCCGPAGFVRHHQLWQGQLFFGNIRDTELDGNAGFCPTGFPPYDKDEGSFAGPDGGLMFPDVYTIDGSLNVVLLAPLGIPYLDFINSMVVWGGQTDIYVQNLAPVDGFVNVLADWNQNGQWGDTGEHILINFQIPTGFNGPLSLLSPPPFMTGPNPGYVWFRYTITPHPLPVDWNGEGELEDGETEDYLLSIASDNPPTACYTWADSDGSGTGTTIDFDASCSTDDFGITNFEWDWTNDGSYDYIGGPTASHVYGDTDPHVCKLRVTDTIGQTGTFTDTVQAIVEIEDVNQSIQDRGFPIRHALDGDWAGAQNFSASVNTLTRVEIYLRRFGTPQFDLTVELREGGPTGTVLDTKIYPQATVPSSWTWFSVDFTDTAVTSSGDYFIVLPPAPSGVTTSFGYEWGYAFGDQYWPGSFWFTRDGGGLWRDLPTMYEFVFSTFGY